MDPGHNRAAVLAERSLRPAGRRLLLADDGRAGWLRLTAEPLPQRDRPGPFDPRTQAQPAALSLPNLPLPDPRRYALRAVFDVATRRCYSAGLLADGSHGHALLAAILAQSCAAQTEAAAPPPAQTPAPAVPNEPAFPGVALLPVAGSLARQAEQQRRAGDYAGAAATLEPALRVTPRQPPQFGTAGP